MFQLRKETQLESYRQIANILARHGLGYLVGVLGLDRFVPFHRRLLGHPRRAEPYTRPEHVWMALEDMGAAFIKLGQILSSRPDLLPPEYQAELVQLQDAAPKVPKDVVEKLLVAEFGKAIEAIFSSFDPEPLAAAFHWPGTCCDDSRWNGGRGQDPQAGCAGTSGRRPGLVLSLPAD